MNIAFHKNDLTLTVEIEGNIDTVTAPELEAQVLGNLEQIQQLILEFSQVNYISSAGLRVVLVLFQKMEAMGGKLMVKNTREEVREVFAMTGFDSLFHLE